MADNKTYEANGKSASPPHGVFDKDEGIYRTQTENSVTPVKSTMLISCRGTWVTVRSN